MRKSSEMRRVGFTLVELLVVISIIGLLISLILVAAADGVRRAEERATQGLITKLETALNDRLDALLNTQPPINQTHRYLAAINTPINKIYVPVGSSTSNSDDRRAQVIAQFDYLKAELPDVFFLNSGTSDGSNFSGSYPLNFAAAPYPSGGTSVANFVLPTGNNAPGLPFVNGLLYPSPANPVVPNYPLLPPNGIFGASFSAAGGIYKNLGYGPKGYDGVDNDNNGMIDDYAEGITGLTAADVAKIATNLANHKHKTARSEMLYAILVEGLSPLGSAFSREDFTAKEVQDTDQDGLPEFVDAWGEPLQFFRWPVYYGSPSANGVILGTSDSQLGCAQYGSPSQTREQDPLDPNQLLVSPAWWSSAANPSLTFDQYTSAFVPPNGGSTNASSPGAIAFMNYFHSLVDPNFVQSGPNTAVWDRGGSFNRRAYFTKFLILSGGPDHEPGVAQFNKDYYALVDSYQAKLNSSYIYTFPNSTLTTEQNALRLIYIENQAAVSDPLVRSGSFFEVPDAGSGSSATFYLNGTANSDDITNHNISGISTGVR